MSQPVLYIGNKNYSSWSLRPWLLLRHFGVDFAEHKRNKGALQALEGEGRSFNVGLTFTY